MKNKIDSIAKFWLAVAVVVGVCVTCAVATTFSSTFDTSTPAGTDSPTEADDRMREIKAAVQERENVDHYWPLTGTEVSDADAGEHRKVTYHETIDDPTPVAGHADLYMQNDELRFQNDVDSAFDITDGGFLKFASLDNLANDTYFKAVDNAGTGTVNLIKANTSDQAEVADGVVLEAATETGDGDRTIVDLAYAKTGDTVTHDSEGGYNNCDIDSGGGAVKTKVYTKYFAGTTDNDPTTSFVHGISSGSTKIYAVIVGVLNADSQWYTGDVKAAVVTADSYTVLWTATNVLINQVGTDFRNKAYRVRIDYIL